MSSGKCYYCNGNHFLYFCEQFLALSVPDRIKEVKRLKLCINCLRNDHFVKTCGKGSCRQCNGKHNTLCHLAQDSKPIIASESTIAKIEENNKSSSNVAVHTANSDKGRRVLMAIARVDATQRNGSSIPIRVLLDSASEGNFITQAAYNRLGLKRNRVSEIVTGLNETENTVSHIFVKYISHILVIYLSNSCQIAMFQF